MFQNWLQQCIAGFALLARVYRESSTGVLPLKNITLNRGRIALPQLAPWNCCSKRWKRSLLWPCSFLINAFDDRPMGDALVMLLMDAHRMLLLLSREVLLWKILCARVQLSSELRQLCLHRQLCLAAAQRPLLLLLLVGCSAKHLFFSNWSTSSQWLRLTLRRRCATKEGAWTFNFLSRLHYYL